MHILPSDYPAVIDRIIQETHGDIRIATPLGLGKPHDFINALYDRVAQNPDLSLSIFTALSLDPPSTDKAGLEARFLSPIVERLYGDDYPRLKYVQAMRQDKLPTNIHIEEFYMLSGSMLSSLSAQTNYTSINYTQVADVIASRHVNVAVQRIAIQDDKLSLSCNTDLTQDLRHAISNKGLPQPLSIAIVDNQLPFISGAAEVAADFFDLIIEQSISYPLFCVPRQPVTLTDYAIGLYASTLVKDGGTLQIGIGTLADAMCHALVLRHTDNAKYRQIIDALDSTLAQSRLVKEEGGLAPFAIGLYGCSEMLSEGFRVLVQQGIIRRKVIDDEALMHRIDTGEASQADHLRLAVEGEYLHGAFYLGSAEFYDWLRTLEPEQQSAIGMQKISEVNELGGKFYLREVKQRTSARFFNTCMSATLLGGAVSETLDDGRVVSGVGGQYNFVSMGHDLADARSVLMFRADRHTQGKMRSNIRYQGGQLTIPRHLRDIYITQYGIADIYGCSDEQCILGMLSICDARYQSELINQAIINRKVSPDTKLNSRLQQNTPEYIQQALVPFQRDGSLPDYPLGSDFTVTEQRILKALVWLKQNTDSKREIAELVKDYASQMIQGDDMFEQLGDVGTDALQRMGLDRLRGMNDRLQAALFKHAFVAANADLLVGNY